AVLGAPSDRWLVAFVAAIGIVLVGGWIARSHARERAKHVSEGEARLRGLRRRAGALLAVGPAVGALLAPNFGVRAAAIAGGAVGLAVFGAVVERDREAGGAVALAAALAAGVAVAGGVRFEPTGVDVLDILLGFGFVFAVTLAFDGLGNADGLVPGLGAVSAL